MYEVEESFIARNDTPSRQLEMTGLLYEVEESFIARAASSRPGRVRGSDRHTEEKQPNNHSQRKSPSGQRMEKITSGHSASLCF
ncbi:hypothetical protein AUK22_09060 [bacterium CG2_30_54_10]|nr:MAG: hypothetical protein AUK22_09060 [bacterium CG2_30_54_10]